MATGRYRLLTADGQPTEDGSADVTVADGALVLAPPAGEVLRVPFGQIASVAEAEPFLLRVTLAQGTVVELSRLGAMRTQVLAELRDAQGAVAATAAAVVGEADPFSGACDGELAQIGVYDDALLVVGASGSERVSFCFVQDVTSADYVVTVRVAGRAPVRLSRLGHRTGEFTEALTQRISAARGRTAAFLGALLPGLDPIALRQAAGLLRDGVAVPAAALDAIHPDLTASLTGVATLPDRRQAVAELASRAELAIGFRQVTSVHRAAAGVTPWQDHAVAPHIGDHDRSGGFFGTGFGGMMAAGLMSGLGPGGFGPFGGGQAAGAPFGFGEGLGGYGGYWAYRALGTGFGQGMPGQGTGAGAGAAAHRPTAQRQDLTRGRLTPAREDLAALTVTGEDPTVLAFALAAAPGRVMFEILNLAEPPTLVFRSPAADGREAIAFVNRALVDTGFQSPAPPGGGPLTAPAPAGQRAALGDLLLGEVSHDERWAGGLAALLAG